MPEIDQGMGDQIIQCNYEMLQKWSASLISEQANIFMLQIGNQ